ncbi:MAG TPA: hypothetical protein VMF14_21400 [Solirubrobacteraceae bacterium]|nr:hypothetical protein [Solirubrobacteraceae bacterium]
MIDQLESELRSALRERADEMPAGAGARVRAHEYRPRTRDLRPPVAAGVLTTAAVAAAAVALVDLGPQASAAFAGWSATPTRASAAQVADAQSDCAQQLSQVHVSATRASSSAPAPTSFAPEISKLSTTTPVLTDTRGPFTFVVFDSGQAHASCITGPGFTSVSMQSSSGTPGAVPADKIVPTFLVHTARAGDAYTFVEGHAGSDATAATLVLSDGSHVQTTLQNGWFVAWWPGGTQLRSAQVTTPSGTTTQALDAQALGGCPAPPSGTPIPAGRSITGIANCTASLAAGRGQAAGSVSVNRTAAGGGTATTSTGG